jgi:Bacterial EndoU nuclease
VERHSHPIVWIVMLLVLGPPFACEVDALAPAGKWTTTDPPINFAHIEFGEINHRGEAVGYHHRPNGADPPGARALRIVQPPDANGVYRARVALIDPATGIWVQKKLPPPFTPMR